MAKGQTLDRFPPGGAPVLGSGATQRADLARTPVHADSEVRAQLTAAVAGARSERR